MDWNPSVDHSFSSIQEILRVLWNPKAYKRVLHESAIG
jgi:hypothetical protein